MSFTGVLGQADSQFGNFVLGSAGGADLSQSVLSTLALVSLTEASQVGIAESTLVLISTADETVLSLQSVSNTLILVSTADKTVEFPRSIISTIVLTQLARTPIIQESITSTLTLTSKVAQTIFVSAENVLALVVTALRIVQASNTLALTNSALGGHGLLPHSELDLITTLTRNVVYNLSPDSILELVQGTAVYIDNQKLCEYNPFVGQGDFEITPPTTIAPVLGSSSIILTFPYIIPTTTLTFRRPDLGNTDELDFGRIKRGSRGNTLIIFAAPLWPKQQTLNLNFSDLIEAQADDLLDFVEQSCGREIGLLDYENRQWRGVLMNPDTEVTQTGRCSYALALVFEGRLA